MGILEYFRADNWKNLFTGIGRKRADPAGNTKFHLEKVLQERELDGLYRGYGLARRIVSTPVRDAMREGFQISGDTDGEVYGYLETQGLLSEFTWFLSLARLYGGALLVIGADDSLDQMQPLNINTLRSISFVKAYGRHNVSLLPIYSDTLQSYDPHSVEFFQVQPYNGISYIVHRSRVIVLDGLDTPDRGRIENLGWGDSALQGPYNELRAMGESFGSVERMLQAYSLDIISVEGLSAALEREEAQAAIKRRMEILQMGRSVFRLMLKDKEEEYERISTSLAGVADALDRMMYRLAASCEPAIPITKLFGRSPGGLNSTGENDVRNYYDDIAALQTHWITPPLRRLIQFVMAAKDCPTGGRELEAWSIDWLPLWQPTDKEKAETRVNIARADREYVMAGVLDPEEVAVSRFGGEEYSMETVLEQDTIEARRSARVNTLLDPDNPEGE